MYQAIVTRYHPATNVKGSRVSARAEAGKVILSWDHGLNQAENHCRAAQALATKFDWKGMYHGGAIPGSRDYAWVAVSLTPRRGDTYFVGE